MKKLFTLAFISLSMTMMAQHVTPLSISVAEINLDSLRAAYLAQPTMYRASLEVVAEQLEQNANQIKVAKNELKVEQTHAKEMDRALNEGMKKLAVLKKMYAKEESEVKSLLKTLETQQKNIDGQTELNQQTRDGYMQMFTNQQRTLEQTLRDIADRVQEMTQLSNELQNAQIRYQNYEQELDRKAFDLAQVESLFKARKETLKAEQKAAKSL